ncbi:Endonuclease/Exonuclease/phosphatase family protein [Streptomyces rubrolavendulae]|uniref:Endonuclease/Exonuclease/phosphatase family protein n=1 Tax=Streptomyces rubrolavendulae TaxID=285473 RepID=A0A1D8G5U2_9ACTN|nr:Endonuclease/Exonuclease/phosphatase family protein [Streptomyces rubrolavendulae]
MRDAADVQDEDGFEPVAGGRGAAGVRDGSGVQGGSGVPGPGGVPGRSGLPEGRGDAAAVARDGSGGTGARETGGRSGWRLRWGRDRRGRTAWSRGRVLAVLAALTAWLIVFHPVVPDLPGRPGSLVEAFLPWLGLLVPVLVAAGLVRRSATALLAALLPVTAWAGTFGGLLLPAPDARHDLTVVQHNVSDENADPAGTARALAAARPDLIALQEVTPRALPAYRAALSARYPHHEVRGTVGLWSAHPLTDVRALDIRPRGVEPGWRRALRATASTRHGDVAVYVAHLPSVRLNARGFDAARRDESAGLLGSLLAAEPLDRVVLLGDLNGTVDDRGLAPLTSRLGTAGTGFAFSWPASAPLARIDHVLARRAEVLRIWTLPPTGSDHLPVAARLAY